MMIAQDSLLERTRVYQYVRELKAQRSILERTRDDESAR